MSRSKQADFKQAEALGHIKTMPITAEAPKEEEAKADDVIDDPDSLRFAVANAQMDGVPYLFVSERVMQYIVRGKKDVSVTYGDPGVRLYVKGTKEGLDELESLPGEKFHERMTEIAKQERVEKQRSR